MPPLGDLPFGSAPLGASAQSGAQDNLRWKLLSALPKDLQELRERLVPLEVSPPRPTLEFSSAGPSMVVQRLSIFLENPKNLRTFLERQLPPQKLTSGQLNDISVCLRHGREFLTAARHSELTVLPLVAFYGFMSYAKALVLSYTDTPGRLQNFPRGHGLRLGGDFSEPLLRLRVKSDGQNKIFHLLLNVLARNSGVPMRAGGRHAWIHVPSATSSEVPALDASLEDLLARVSGIEGFYLQTLGAQSLSLPAEFWHPPPYTHPPRVVLEVKDFSPNEREHLYEINPRLRTWHLVEEWSRQRKVDFLNLPPQYYGDLTDLEAIRGSLLPVENMIMPLDRAPSGEWRLLTPINEINLPGAAIVYLASFILGSVARYRPDVWSDVTSFPGRSEASRLRALVEEFYHLILRRFPLQMLASIMRTEIAVWDRGLVMIS